MDMGSDDSGMNNSQLNAGLNYTSNDGCMIKVLDLSVKDNLNFIQSNNDNNVKVISTLSFFNITYRIAEPESVSKIYFDTSPPPVYGNPLYITNSILLI